jgi:hypothetical protein
MPFVVPAAALLVVACLLFLAYRCGILLAVASAVFAVALITSALAYWATVTDYRDADGFVDCWPNCTAIQDATRWGAFFAPVVALIAAVAALFGLLARHRSAPKEPRKKPERLRKGGGGLGRSGRRAANLSASAVRTVQADAIVAYLADCWRAWCLAILGTVDALRDSPSRSKPALRNPYLAPSPTPAAQASNRLPRCTAGQLALRVENLGGSPALALVHVWAGPCRTARLPIDISVFDRKGKRVQATVLIQRAFAPTTLSPNAEVIAGFNLVYLCGERKPVRVVAEAGAYPARGQLPHGYACVDDLGPYTPSQ